MSYTYSNNRNTNFNGANTDNNTVITYDDLTNNNIIKIVNNIITYLNIVYRIDYSIDLTPDDDSGNIDRELVIDTISGLYKYTFTVQE